MFWRQTTQPSQKNHAKALCLRCFLWRRGFYAEYAQTKQPTAQASARLVSEVVFHGLQDAKQGPEHNTK